MIIRETPQGFEAYAVIDGVLKSQQYIGYTKAEARMAFVLEFGRQDIWGWTVLDQHSVW